MNQHPAVRLAVVALFILVLDLIAAGSTFVGYLNLNQSQANQAAIVKLNTALDRAEAAARAAAKAQAASAQITLHFLNEINYICTISSLRAKESGLPPPSVGLCNLTVPTQH